jgi:hypothetical protein
MIPAITQVFEPDGSGVGTVDLVPGDSTEPPFEYLCEVRRATNAAIAYESYQFSRFRVPDGSGALDMADLIAAGTPPVETSYWRSITELEYDAAIAAVAASEDAADRAEAAAANFGISTITALKAVAPTTPDIDTAFLTDAVRQGPFVWRAGNYTTAVANDPTGAVYVKADTISAATGAWVRADVLDTARPRVLDLAWFGWRADGTTDNTTAMNAALAEINALGGEVTVMVPEGVGRIGDCDPLTVGNVTFKARGRSAFWGVSSAGMFHLGNAAGPVRELINFEGIFFAGNAVAAQRLVTAANVQNVFLEGCEIGTGVATFMRLGNESGAGNNVSNITINNLRGRCSNVAAPLFQLVNGAGFHLNNPTIYNEAFGGGGTAVAGRHFVECFEGSWNTCDMTGGSAFLFDQGFAIDIQSTKTFGDFVIRSARLDEANIGVSLIAQSGGAIANVDLHDFQTTGKRGQSVRVLGGGDFNGLRLRAVRGREVKGSGIAIFSPVRELTVESCEISGVAEPFEFVGSIAGTVLTITARNGFPGGTPAVGDIITGAGVAPGTTITSVAPNNAVTGAFGVSISQTVASTTMTTGTGRDAAFYMASGSSDVTIVNNTFGTKIDGLLGPGNAAYGMLIEGGTRFRISGNSCKGTIANESITGLTDSESDTAWFPYTVALTSSGGGAFGAATATGTYQRTGRKVKVSITGTITTVGAATGFLLPSLPFAAAATPAVEYTGTGIQVGATVSVSAAAGAGSALVVRYDGAATATVTGGFSVSLEYQI